MARHALERSASHGPERVRVEQEQGLVREFRETLEEELHGASLHRQEPLGTSIRSTEARLDNRGGLVAANALREPKTQH